MNYTLSLIVYFTFISVNYTDVPFHGLSYKFQHITVGSKTTSFPVLFPNTSYIITTDYNASKVLLHMLDAAVLPVIITTHCVHIIHVLHIIHASSICYTCYESYGCKIHAFKQALHALHAVM